MMSGLGSVVPPSAMESAATAAETDAAATRKAWPTRSQDDGPSTFRIDLHQPAVGRAESLNAPSRPAPAPKPSEPAASDDWLTLFDDATDPGLTALAIRPPALAFPSHSGSFIANGGATAPAPAQPMIPDLTLPSTSPLPTSKPTVSQAASIAMSTPVATLPSTAPADPVDAQQASGLANALGTESPLATEVSPTSRGTVSPLEPPQPLEVQPVLMATSPSVSGGYVTSRRTAPGPSAEATAYPIKPGEHFDTASTFEFKLENPASTTDSPIHWAIWRLNGDHPNIKLNSGSGSQFTADFDDNLRDWVHVLFWEDVNLTGSFDSGDTFLYTSDFWVQPRAVYNINVAVSDVLPANTASLVQARLTDAENLLLRTVNTIGGRLSRFMRTPCMSFRTPTSLGPAQTQCLMIPSNAISITTTSSQTSSLLMPSKVMEGSRKVMIGARSSLIGIVLCFLLPSRMRWGTAWDGTMPVMSLHSS